ncbi:MAG: HAD family hydrolase [Fibrobacteres bacterium]|nr:HAD family hydrolase [Fibrobacterota bacterium]
MTQQMPTIKRIFFDSGKVLVYPKSGEWMFPNKYKELCKNNNLPEKTASLERNFEVAMQNLAQHKFVLNELEEYSVFKKFYETVFKNEPYKNNETFIDSVTKAKVSDYDKYRFFDDVKPSIQRLKNKYNLGLITDAWPSIITLYKKAEMFNFFDPFVVSSIYGTTKEEKKLFKIALDKIPESPNECLFVDDSLVNCRIAKEFNMHAIALIRNNCSKTNLEMDFVTTLTDLEKYLQN